MGNLKLVYSAPVVAPGWAWVAAWWACASILPAVWLACWRYPGRGAE